MNVLAFDPGHTTGWAYFCNGKIATGSFSMWSGVRRVFRTYALCGIDIVIIESFILRRGVALALSGSKLETVQVIGYIKAISDFHGRTLIEQPPSCKSIKVAKIKGTNIHAMDAVKHGLYYLKKNKEAKLYRKFFAQ